MSSQSTFYHPSLLMQLSARFFGRHIPRSLLFWNPDSPTTGPPSQLFPEELRAPCRLWRLRQLRMSDSS
jgi:hypothetical protein